MWDSVREFESLGNRTVMGILLLAVFAALAVSTYLANKGDNDFRIVDALMENGKASKWAIILFGSWIVHTWVLVSWVLNGAATLADLTTYGGTWVAPLVAKMFIKPKDE